MPSLSCILFLIFSIVSLGSQSNVIVSFGMLEIIYDDLSKGIRIHTTS